jgi:hypothetical protein
MDKIIIDEGLDESRALKSTNIWVINSPEIQELKKKICNSPEIETNAGKIFEFVVKNLKYEKVEGRKDIFWVLKHKKGDCEGFTDLYITLARACNIPTVLFEGIADNVGHVWAAKQINYWSGLDPTWESNTYVPSSHITLGFTEEDKIDELLISYYGSTPQVTYEFNVLPLNPINAKFMELEFEKIDVKNLTVVESLEDLDVTEKKAPGSEKKERQTEYNIPVLPGQSYDRRSITLSNIHHESGGVKSVQSRSTKTPKALLLLSICVVGVLFCGVIFLLFWKRN